MIMQLRSTTKTQVIHTTHELLLPQKRQQNKTLGKKLKNLRATRSTTTRLRGEKNQNQKSTLENSEITEKFQAVSSMLRPRHPCI
jgi:hypothetical protein